MSLEQAINEFLIFNKIVGLLNEKIGETVGKDNEELMNRFWIIALFVNFGFFFEKEKPFLNRFEDQINNDKSIPTVLYILKDFKSQRFNDIRNAIMHWNYTGIPRPKFFSRREPENKEESDYNYISKTYSAEEIFVFEKIASIINQSIITALNDAIMKRSH